MKQTLDPEIRAAMVDYRLDRARETLGEADVLTDSGYFNAAVNRLYYACFYAASALLLSRHTEAGTHNGTKTQLSLYYVRPRRLAMEHNNTYNVLFDKRHSGDYSDFIFVDATFVREYRPRAEAFINAVEKLTREEQADDPERANDQPERTDTDRAGEKETEV